MYYDEKHPSFSLDVSFLLFIFMLYNPVLCSVLFSITFVSCVTKEGLKDLQEKIYVAAISTKGRGTDEHVIGMQV